MAANSTKRLSAQQRKATAIRWSILHSVPVSLILMKIAWQGASEGGGKRERVNKDDGGHGVSLVIHPEETQT
jgi:hypothetical protein